MKSLNLACGSSYVDDPSWTNIDYSPHSKSVKKANLLKRLPFNSSTFDLVYSSHFVEHIPATLLPSFLAECYRVLKPGGYLRLVLPDLAILCNLYLEYCDHSNPLYSEFISLEIVDQCVRKQPGGSLSLFYKHLLSNPGLNKDIVDFVRYVNGENLLAKPKKRSFIDLSKLALLRLPSLISRVWVYLVAIFLPMSFRDQNLSFAMVGERHQWIYDYPTISKKLRDASFVSIAKVTASSSSNANFPCYPLDITRDGSLRKGIESMYIEAQK